MQDFLFLFAYDSHMFHSPRSKATFTVSCKRCGETISAGIKEFPFESVLPVAPQVQRRGNTDPLSSFEEHLSLDRAHCLRLRLARDPRAGHKSERVIYAVEDAVFLAKEIYDRVCLRYGNDHMDFDWDW